LALVITKADSESSSQVVPVALRSAGHAGTYRVAAAESSAGGMRLGFGDVVDIIDPDDAVYGLWM
jgi:hypothetical protein